MFQKNFKPLLFAFLLATLVYACKKSFLTSSPRGALDEATLANAKGLNQLLIGAYAMLDNYDAAINHDQFGVSASNQLFGDIGGSIANKGSFFGDNLAGYGSIQRHDLTSANGILNDEWRVLYEGIKRSNQVLRVLQKTADLPDADRKNIEGQSRFLRGWYHFLGRIVFKKFAYIDLETDDKLVSGEIGGVTNDEEIFPKILEDAKYAYENLPEPQNAIGRINKWSAGAFYGKVLLYTKDFATARQVLNNVVDNGKNPLGVKYELSANYSDNFNVEKENSPESVFAFQATAQDNAGAENSNWGDVLHTPGPVGGGAGFFTPTYFFTNHFKTDANGLPVSNPQSNVVLDPYGQAGYTEYTGTVDPRLDWTIGRNGIPFLDWGVTDHSWARGDGEVEPFSSGPFLPKKTCIRSSQIGGYHDATIWFTTGGVALNVNFIRFADVLLMAAEAEAEDGGSLSKAWQLVNRVRARAANTPGVKKYINNANPAAGFSNVDAGAYKAAPYLVVFASKEEAIKAVRLERLLELGMEGFRFFDLVRWGIAQQEMNAYFQYETQFPYSKVLKTPSLVPAYQSPAHDYYPVPQAQIDLSNGMLQP